jgi:hypothetical protein
VSGALSALPIVAAGNVCCCLWVVSGGAIAAYLLQQSQPAPIGPGDGAFVGLLTGVAGAFVYLVVSIPLTILLAPMQELFVQRMIETEGMPPEVQEVMRTFAGGGVRLALGFIAMLIVGSIFSTLGGLLGAVLFRKQAPGTIDIPPST